MKRSEVITFLGGWIASPSKKKKKTVMNDIAVEPWEH